MRKRSLSMGYEKTEKSIKTISEMMGKTHDVKSCFVHLLPSRTNIEEYGWPMDLERLE